MVIAKYWKAHMSKVINEENERDQIVDAYTVEGPFETMMREEIIEALKH